MFSDLWKSTLKMASEDSQKNIATKVQKNMKLSGFLAISKVLTTHRTNFLRLFFNSQFFLSFNFYFGHKTTCDLKTWEN